MDIQAASQGPVLDVATLSGRATITVDEAAQLLGIGRTAAYEAARRGQLPTRRLGRRLFVPVPAFLGWLGVPVDAASQEDALPIRARSALEPSQ